MTKIVVAFRRIRRLFLTTMVGLAVAAADWPQFRGPNRDGVWNETGVAKSFPPGGLKVSWRVPVGPGWSSPIVVQSRVYLTDVALARPMARERVLCFDEANGRLLWNHTYAVDYPDWAFEPNTAGPRATPILQNGKFVFLYTDRGDLIQAQLTPQSYREISRAHLLDPTSPFGNKKCAWTPPAYANRHIFARNDQELVCASLAATP